MSATTTPARSSRDTTIPVGRHAWVTIRPIESSDADGLFDFYARLSASSRHERFLGSCAGIDIATARRFAGVDHRARDGLVAVLRRAGADDGAIVGHACMEADRPGAEEVAFAVADAFQGKGIGTALMRAAVRSARRRGIGTLIGTTFATNVPMRRVALRASPRVAVHAQEAGVEAFVIDVAG